MARTTIIGDADAAVGTAATAIDTNGYGIITFVINAAATGTFALTECDTSGGTYTAVDSADSIIPTISAAGAYLAGYIGNKRYLKYTLSGTDNTAVILKTEKRMAT